MRIFNQLKGFIENEGISIVYSDPTVSKFVESRSTPRFKIPQPIIGDI